MGGGGHHKTGIFLGVIYIHLGLFLKVKVQYWNSFGELLNFNYFGGYA